MTIQKYVFDINGYLVSYFLCHDEFLDSILIIVVVWILQKFLQVYVSDPSKRIIFAESKQHSLTMYYFLPIGLGRLEYKHLFYLLYRS